MHEEEEDDILRQKPPRCVDPMMGAQVVPEQQEPREVPLVRL